MEMPGTYLEGHLCSEGELVAFKQASCGVDEHGECDAVNKVKNALFDFVRWFRFLNSFLKHCTEGL